MESVKSFNGLHGTIVSRDRIIELLEDARDDEQFLVAERLETVLASYPDAKKFDWENSEPAFEEVPESFLHGLDYEEGKDDSQGLAKPVSPSDVYDMITNKMIGMIKEANSKDWKKKWNGKTYGTGYTVPFNFVSKKRYRGVNVLMLTELEPLENPFFLTFKQVTDLKGKVKKGAKGHEVVYFTKIFKTEDRAKNLKFSSYDKSKVESFATENGIEADKMGAIPMLKYYNVFNGKDIEGIDFKLESFKIGFVSEEKPADEANKMPVCELIIKNYPQPQPKLKFGGDRAFFRGGGCGLVQMPYLSDFETVQDYYRTLFHEYSHSTGTPQRLNRDMTGKFSSKPYAFEELVAELGGTFLSAEAGIIWHNTTNHAAYLKSWNRVLTQIQDDNKFVMKAATLAQKVADFVLQFDASGNPLYFKDLKPEPSKIKEAIKKAKKTASDYGKKRKFEAKKKAGIITKKEEKTDPKEEVKQKRVITPEKKPVKKEVSRVKKEKQLSLFGAKKGLKSAVIEDISEVIVKSPQPAIHPNLKRMGENSENVPSEFYSVGGEVGRFLQQVERKPVHSVVITLDGEQGAGKTTTLYKFIDAFASEGNKCLFISGEEHPDSFLAKDKQEKYISKEALPNISTTGEVKSIEELYEIIDPFEIVFIDSWQKLLRMIGNIRLDEDLRKRFNGKVFVVIFQQTTTGRTKGGAEVVFDGDIIIKMVKEPNFSENYAFFDKNRYTLIPLETIRYNIANGTIYNPEEKKQLENEPNPAQDFQPIKFSFNTIEN
jgi:antirestriction protein ArdC